VHNVGKIRELKNVISFTSSATACGDKWKRSYVFLKLVVTDAIADARDKGARNALTFSF